MLLPVEMMGCVGIVNFFLIAYSKCITNISFYFYVLNLEFLTKCTDYRKMPLKGYKEDFLLHLIQTGAIKFGVFKLKGSRISPYLFRINLHFQTIFEACFLFK
jgi:hypothetical protein